MGLRDEAEKLLSDSRRQADEDRKRYREATLAAVPGALEVWCRRILDVDAPDDYKVTKEESGSYDDSAWAHVWIQFSIEAIPFEGHVDFYPPSTHGVLGYVRINKNNASNSHIIDSKFKLAMALEHFDDPPRKGLG